MKFFLSKLILLLFLVPLQVKAVQTPNSIGDITFYTENYPPANFMVENELKGVTVDTLKAIWKHLAVPEQEIILIPWARGYRFALDHNNSALFTMSKTPGREKLFKWVGPIFHSTHVLMAKKSKQLKFDNLGQIFNHQVATVQGDISEISLYQIGFPSLNMAKVSRLNQAFQMMELDRVDMMVITPHGFSYLAQQLDFDVNEYEQVWEINKVGNYIAFNINTPDDIIETYQKTLEAIPEQRLLIKEEYKIPKIDY